MVALLRHQPVAGRSPVVAPARPHLRLVPEVDEPSRPSLGPIVAVALVVFGLLGAVRVVQGQVVSAADPGGGGSEVAVPAPAVPAPGDQVVVAGPGDSLWSIAATLAPDGDRRPVVAALIDANGSDSIQIGQQIVIPRHLLD